MTEVFFQPQQWRYEGIVCLKGKRTQSDSRHSSRRRNLHCLVVFIFKTLCVFYVIENVYLPFNKVHEKITQFWLRQFSGNSMQKKVNPVQRSNKLDWLIPWTVQPHVELLCALRMWKYHCILLFWSYAVVLTERTVWINYFCTWCARFAYA